MDGLQENTSRTGNTTIKLAVAALVVIVLALLARSFLFNGDAVRDLRIIHASGFTPVLAGLRDDTPRDLGIELVMEASGSQVAARKVSELGRTCDIIVLADNALVVELLPEHCSWRLDVAGDEVVLAVGSRAPKVDEAEKNWASVLLGEDARIARVNENLGPIGYRTLLVWRLAEMRGRDGLYERLMAKSDLIVDHVSRLTPLLKTGEADYAFVYRSICIASDIRYIELDDSINLSSPDIDYSAASVTFARIAPGESSITHRGEAIVWTLSIPDEGADEDLAMEFIRYLIKDRADIFTRNGFRLFDSPRFYGTEAEFEPFRDIGRYAGPLR